MCDISVLVLHNQLIAGLVVRQVEWNSSGGRTQSQGAHPLASPGYMPGNKIYSRRGKTVTWL